MYLKSIEMQGFKSFAGKMTLEFHNGITGIVGPNGSGKSNISDAVRWVLGEQSAKQLRGASMQDVIFAGTENRKPLSYAYVAITLDNSDHTLAVDYDEVTVARRVYRSGESEYLMNGAVCRLRDVSELFYDTGIGKEGYSIIGQGQIDKILSGKPEDRRELFDEAAGIVKFKKRKQATLKKLMDEEDNLLRVTDILNELEGRVGPLERQSETARQYLKKKEELKRYDVNMFILEYERLNEQLEEIAKNQGITEAQLNEQHEKENALKEEYSRIEQAINDGDEKLRELYALQQKTSIDKEKLENQIRLYEEQIRLARVSDEGLDDRKAAISADIASLEGQLAEKEEEYKELKVVLDELEDKLNAAKSKEESLSNRIDELKKQIESDQNKSRQLLDDMSDLKSKEQRLVAVTEQLAIRRAELTQRMLSRKKGSSDIEETLALSQSKEEEAKAKLDTVRNKNRELKNRLYQFESRLKELSTDYNSAKSNVQKKEAMLESLKNLAERYEGYGHAVKRVMDAKESNNKICGVVSDLISVDKRYEIAIETALGGNVQNVVTEDEETAKALIAYLKENKYGRVTFLPVSSVKPSSGLKHNECLSDKGAIGVASELVKCENKYRDIASHLLGRVLVVDTISNALNIAKKYHYSMHIVTLEGEYLSPGGSLTGGSFKNNSNLLGRSREIDALEAEIAELKAGLSTKKVQIDELETAISLLEEDIEENAAVLNEAVIEENTASIQLQVASEQQDENQKAYDSLHREGEELSRQANETENDKLSIQKEKVFINESSEAINKRLESLTEELESLTDQLSLAIDESQAISIEDAKARQAVDFAKENTDRITEEISRRKADLKSLDDEAANARIEVEEKLKNIEETKLTIEAAGKQAVKIEEDIQKALNDKDMMNASHKNLFESREEISEAIRVLDKESFRLAASKEKASEALAYQNSYMWEEYELTYHNALSLKDDEIIAAGGLKKIISSIKDEIRQMGNVNVNAIEEYKEVSERYNFLKTQHDDLVLAKQNLEDIIAELDDGMRKQFQEEFANIQREFDKTFKELFGGGKGTLELLEGEDILETGISIIAQPPGKKLQNMMQLSGGEKALTAIALLFAIQNLKPSPFCLLDEIEAALDDVNVDRFANYLHKLTKNTQFIVITHRRGTMTAADRLYGITMQEKGISAMVSVNLIENELSD